MSVLFRVASVSFCGCEALLLLRHFALIARGPFPLLSGQLREADHGDQLVDPAAGMSGAVCDFKIGRFRRRSYTLGLVDKGDIADEGLGGLDGGIAVQRHHEGFLTLAPCRRADDDSAVEDVLAGDGDLTCAGALISNRQGLAAFPRGTLCDCQSAAVEVGGISVGQRRGRIEDHRSRSRS